MKELCGSNPQTVFRLSTHNRNERMRLGVISDIHSNLPALEAVDEALPAVDRVVCAGDVVGYNPWPAECLEYVRTQEILTVQGNHDRAVAVGGGDYFNSMAKAGVTYSREQLDDEQLEWLGSLPTERFLAEGRVHIVHGHPDNPDRYTYPRSFSPSMLADGVDLLVVGHTHIQAQKEFESGVMLNPGSVGQPRDGESTAAFAVVELDESSVDVALHRIEYDTDQVIEAVDKAGLPSRIGTRLRSGS